MSIVSLESADEKNVSASILNFLTAYGVISLLSKCGGTKLKNAASPCLTRLGSILTLFVFWGLIRFQDTFTCNQIFVYSLSSSSPRYL